MATNLFDIGRNGLQASRIATAVSSNNMLNERTPGYTRRDAVQSEAPGARTSGGIIGSGARIDDIRRITDIHLNERVDRTRSANAAHRAYGAQAAALSGLFPDRTTGVTAALGHFFTALGKLASAPDDTAVRQEVVSAAQSLASRFNSLQRQFDSQRDALNGKIGDTVSAINTLTEHIAESNRLIAQTTAMGKGSPNDLLDRRDLLLSQLSEQVDIDLLRRDDGHIDVRLSRGQPLVVGERHRALAAIASASDPSRTIVGYRAADGATTRFAEDAFAGGQLGGLLAFRREALDPAQDALGALAANVASAHNRQHQLGVDARGRPGENLFSIGQPVVHADLRNTGGAGLGATLSTPGVSPGDDYIIAFQNGRYTVTRLSDNRELYNDAATPSRIGDGTITLSFTGTPASGDIFTVRTRRPAALAIGVAQTDPAGIAAAAPLRGKAPLANAGAARIDVSVSSDYRANPSPIGILPIEFTYSPDSGGTLKSNRNLLIDGRHYAVNEPIPSTPGSTLKFSVVDKSGATVQLGGIEIRLSGTPSESDKFSIEANDGGSEDGRNAGLLVDLQSQRTMGGTATFTEHLSQLLGRVGSIANKASGDIESSAATLRQWVQMQQSVSGVSIDEELARLIAQDKIYQASARVIDTASRMLDTILGLGR